MSTQHNATYTVNGTQNEILDCLAEMFCSSIIREVKESECFSIMVDETKDMSQKEQISMELRCYYY